MANLSKTTQDHEEIRSWAEERGGKPSHVKSTGSAEDIGILRIDFPGYGSEARLEPISWDEWFEKFDERNLAFLYQEETAGGERSSFNKIVSAQTAEENEARQTRTSGSRHDVKSAARSRSSSKRATSKKTASKSASKKSASKKAASKKSASKKAASKKLATRAGSSRPSRARSASKSPVAGRSSGRKSAAKRSSKKRR